MELVEVPKGAYFICPGNFLFIKDKQTGGKTYLKCKDSFCSARIILQEGHQLVLRVEHNHLPDMVLLQEIRLKSILAFRSRTETTTLLHIFMEEEIRHHEASLRLPNGFNSVKPMMQRERRKVQPPIPATLEEAAVYLANTSYRKYALELGPQQRTFFDGIRNGCLLFISRAILNEAISSNNVQLHMDGTFKIVPRAGGAHQLFIIHWMRDHTAYPVVFCLMPNRTRQAYVGVLRYTRQLFGASLVSSVLCDYELALRQAVLEVFPGISLRGCWFHFAKNVFLKARQMLINDAVAVRMAMALPLLPTEKISEGIDFVCQRINNDGFSRYMQRQWRNTNVSVFGFNNRTNNAVEFLHGQLLRIIGRAHPNFWVFVQFLQKFEHYKCSDLLRVLSGMQLRRRERRRYVELNQRINNAQHRFGEDGNLQNFFSVTSHTVIGIHRLFDPNVPIEEIPDAEGMVPNDVQGLEEVPIVDMYEEDAALEPLVEMLEIPTDQDSDEFPVQGAADEPNEQLPQEPQRLPEQPSAQEPEDSPFAGRCVACYSEHATQAVVPCGHVVYCNGCLGTARQVGDISRCPQCRGNVQQFFAAFCTLNPYPYPYPHPFSIVLMMIWEQLNLISPQ